MPKIKKVMEEYKSGRLHSGSKKGPVVKSRKQAMAIAISEAEDAGETKSKSSMKRLSYKRKKSGY